MEKAYNFKKYEERIYSLWEKTGAFCPSTPTENKKSFTIIMPPPNANDPLHIGHAMFVTIEDILIRYHRMLGESTLWLPGTDHAGIETQYVFEKKLAKQGKSRFDFDRKTLYQKIWNYVQENSGVAINQMKRLGASADWTRYKFTLNPEIVKFVTNTFMRLFKDGLIYRGERLVNYCTKCGTGYSELEIEYVERKDPLYYIRYSLASDPKKFIVVATTRPEPIYADTHLAVNPKDKKNKNLIGKKIINPLTGLGMKIIADEFVDPNFGTGIVKLTPAHDANDFEAAQKHNLPIVQAIDTQGRMLGGPSEGKKVSIAREESLKIIEGKGLLERVDKDYLHRIATCYRCHSVIEPLPLPQFFIKVKSLTKGALDALDKKETVVLGTGREKILRNWLKNLRDWNISRQIVWGIRIPVWYSVSTNPDMDVVFLNTKKEVVRGKISDLLKTHKINEIEKGLQRIFVPKDAEYTIGTEKPGKNYLQETDTFDTWFSSGQWPVVTLKTNKKGDFENFYPTAVMDTGYDILPFWVMRMIMLGIYLTGKSPFKTVYLHGLIRDEQGRKMSKSIGNVINPIDMVDKYGADALRMALVMSSSPGVDKNVGETQIRGMRNFSNKIWNAARFILQKSDEENNEGKNDAKFIKKLVKVEKEITKNLDTFKIGLASEKLYSYFWHWYCDKCIEENKKGLISNKGLLTGLSIFLKLLHPFVPFVTEAIWQENKKLFEYPSLIETPWPK